MTEYMFTLFTSYAAHEFIIQINNSTYQLKVNFRLLISTQDYLKSKNVRNTNMKECWKIIVQFQNLN